MNRTFSKSIAICLSAVMLLSCLCGCGAAPQPAAVVNSSEVRQVSDAAVMLLQSHHSVSDKEETVYVISSPDGTPEQTIVSVWLKNPDGEEIITDYATLSDIENVKGDETYSVDSNGRLVWQANGNDIYYQGNSNQPLPVSTSISYTLDGKKMSGNDLAGKSGHLVITFSYKNNMASEQIINGELVTLYQPFLVISGLVLDNNQASAVSVTNGKIINTGDQTVVVGMAMPGLSESLGINDLHDADGKAISLNIPDTVVIEADVVDFSLLTTLTIIENSLLDDLNLDHVETLDDLQDAIGQLGDASSRLVSGTSELYDGISKLSSGSAALNEGIGAVDAGAGELKAGASELADGTKQVADGAASVSSGAADLVDGAGQLSEGAAALREIGRAHV